MFFFNHFKVHKPLNNNFKFIIILFKTDIINFSGCLYNFNINMQLYRHYVAICLIIIIMQITILFFYTRKSYKQLVDSYVWYIICTTILYLFLLSFSNNMTIFCFFWASNFLKIIQKKKRKRGQKLKKSILRSYYIIYKTNSNLIKINVSKFLYK